MNCPECGKTIAAKTHPGAAYCCHYYGKYRVRYWVSNYLGEDNLKIEIDQVLDGYSRQFVALLQKQWTKMDEERIERIRLFK